MSSWEKVEAVKKIVDRAVDEAVKIAIVEERALRLGVEAERDFWREQYGDMLSVLVSTEARRRRMAIAVPVAGILGVLGGVLLGFLLVR